MNALRFAQFLPTLLVAVALIPSTHSMSVIPQPSPAPCRCAPRDVGESGSRKNWEGYGNGIRWHYSIREAMRIAEAENKHVFWLHVSGDLDKEGC